MIDVREKRHKIAGLGLREFSATFDQSMHDEGQVHISLTNMKATLALHRPEGTCGMVNLHPGVISEKTKAKFLELITLLEQDARNLLFFE